MTVYNGERYIREAIDSILNQTFQDYEFLIIDDCSTDNTLKIIKEYEDPRIKLIETEKNIGFIKSLNMGIALSQGEYIARQDADDISLPDRLFEEVIFLDSNPDIAMVGTARELIDEFGVTIRDIIPKKNPNFQDICKGNPFQHSSIMIRKSILLEFGGYDERFPYCEDHALWLTISKKYKVYNIQKIICKLRIHKESISIKKFEEQALAHILVIRMGTNQLTDNDFKGIHEFGVHYLKDKLCEHEKIYYLYRLAEFHTINEKFIEARKIYLKIFFMNPLEVFSIINYFKLILGKRFFL
jgi:glycosyltransferase involved in cell wall biosynthesis